MSNEPHNAISVVRMALSRKPTASNTLGVRSVR